jgi:hypothetical protein
MKIKPEVSGSRAVGPYRHSHFCTQRWTLACSGKAGLLVRAHRAPHLRHLSKRAQLRCYRQKCHLNSVNTCDYCSEDALHSSAMAIHLRLWCGYAPDAVFLRRACVRVYHETIKRRMKQACGGPLIKGAFWAPGSVGAT